MMHGQTQIKLIFYSVIISNTDSQKSWP